MNSSSPPPPKPDHLFLAFTFLLFTASSLLLIYLIKNPGFLSKVTLDLSEIGKTKIEVTPEELDEAYQLEGFLNLPPSPSTASAVIKESSPSNSNASPLDDSLKNMSRERVVLRKILRAEAKNLKVDLAALLRSVSSPAEVKTEDGRTLPTNLAPLFVDDRTLIETFRRKIEGYAKLVTVMVDFKDNQSSPEAKTLSQSLYDSLKKNPRQDLGELIASSKPKEGLSVGFQSLNLFGKQSQMAQSEERSPYQSGIAGQSYFFRLVTEGEKGLGQSFEEWYQNVKKEYL